MKMKHTMKVCSILFALNAVLALLAGPACAQQKKPNILVIWGDDIGIDNMCAHDE
jgi:hypothetical protein